MPGDTSIIEVLFEVPKAVSAGLADKSLVRRGGVIQVASGADRGHVVLWLRETAGLINSRGMTSPFNFPGLESQVAALQSNLQTMMGLQFLTLGLTAIGFIVLSLKLDHLSRRIDSMLSAIEALGEDVAWLHRRLDYALLARVLSALEWAERGRVATRSDDLYAALDTLTEAAHHYRLLVDDILTWKRHLRHPEALRAYEQQWLLAIIGKAHCYIALGDQASAEAELAAGQILAKNVLDRFVEPFRKFDRHLQELIPLGASERQAISEARLGLHEAANRLISARAELAFIRQAKIPYEDWATLASDIPEPKLVFLKPQVPVLLKDK